VKCYICSIALYGAEAWTLRKLDQDSYITEMRIVRWFAPCVLWRCVLHSYRSLLADLLHAVCCLCDHYMPRCILLYWVRILLYWIRIIVCLHFIILCCLRFIVLCTYYFMFAFYCTVLFTFYCIVLYCCIVLLYRFVCTRLGLLPPGAKPIAVNNNNNNNINNNAESSHFVPSFE
jgi:hypothetical protein